MGYGENTDAGDAVPCTVQVSYPIVVFMSISLYNVIELNILTLTTFKKRYGLYFWSFVAATNGIIPHTVGFLLKNVVYSANFILYITLISVGWVMMVTGQSLVLYSRLHLILWNQLYRKLVLAMILTNVVILHIPIIILMYGSNSSHDNPFIHPYMIYEKIQVTVFFLQELIISAIYIRTCYSFFDAKGSLYGDGVRKMRQHLLWVNVMIILLDIPILILEYLDRYDLQTAYKALVYSVKLKLEFNILNRLLDMSQGNTAAHPRTHVAGHDAGAGIGMDTFNSGDASGNHRVHTYNDKNGDAKSGEMGKRNPDTGIVRSTEIVVHSVERRDEDSDSMERKQTGGSHYWGMKHTGQLSKSSSEVNLATRGF